MKSPLWHKRLGHPTNEVVKSTLTASALYVLDDSSRNLCCSCLHGKMYKLPFSNKHDKARIHFKRLHSDVLGSALIIVHLMVTDTM